MILTIKDFRCKDLFKKYRLPIFENIASTYLIFDIISMNTIFPIH